jgi:peptidoglycan/LPS O-acetylase OafA/YrhL
MANANQFKAKTSSTPAPPLSALSIAAPLAGWLLPGAGHIIQKRWIRGLLLMLAVVVLFFAGLGMQGKVYAFNTGDLLDILGFLGDFGAGALYLAARNMDWGQAIVPHATADYGTKYMIVAGLLNIVSAVDAYHIASGKKQ